MDATENDLHRINARRRVLLSGAGIAAFPALMLSTYPGSACAPAEANTSAVCAFNFSESSVMPSVVDVAAFGAIGDGIADDTNAIQMALEGGNVVLFPSDRYRITASLTVGSQRLVGLGKVASRAQTLLVCDGNFPAFINRQDSWDSFSIDGFFIDFGETAPTNQSTQGARCGFKFTGEQTWPEQMIIRNCVVRGAWHGFYDNTGTYMSILERVEARHCRIGFIKHQGTTITFLNCFARGDGTGSRQGFVITNVLSPTLISCAADRLVPQPGDFGESANYFQGLSGLTILGWDAEGNGIGPNLAYMKLDNCSGDVRGFTGYKNKLYATEPDATYFLWALSSFLTFSGSSGRSDDDLVYEGGSSTATTIFASEGAEVLVQGAIVRAPIHPKPTAAFACAGRGGSVFYSASEIVGGMICTYRTSRAEVSLDRPVLQLGVFGLFLNVSDWDFVYGDLVPGSLLLPSSASGAVSDSRPAEGEWTCLGKASGLARPGAVPEDCVTLFQRVN